MSTRDRLFYLVLGLISLVSLALALVGASGYPEVRRLRAECAKVEAENEALNRERVALERRVEALENDLKAVERRAREDLGMVRPGETVILLDGKKP